MLTIRSCQILTTSKHLKSPKAEILTSVERHASFLISKNSSSSQIIFSENMHCESVRQKVNDIFLDFHTVSVQILSKTSNTRNRLESFQN